MTESAASSAEFIVAGDLEAGDASWQSAEAQLAEVRDACARVLGFQPVVNLALLPATLRQAIDAAAARGASEIFVLPAAFDFSLWHREALGEILAESRRTHPSIAIHHDDVDLGHPFLVRALADGAARAIAQSGSAPQECGIILTASGKSDCASRADTYRLMRLVWEELGVQKGEVAFIRDAHPSLSAVLENCAHNDLHWFILPQSQWWGRPSFFVACQPSQQSLANGRGAGTHACRVETRLDACGPSPQPKLNSIGISPPEVGQAVPPATGALAPSDACGPPPTPAGRPRPASSVATTIAPPTAHPALTSWYAQRMLRLWRDKRDREATRQRSPKAAPSTRSVSPLGAAIIARIPDHDAMREVLARILPTKPDRILVKVTWHGYATGTYTDPAALDLLLGALPARAIVLEGHTSSRNLGGADFDWETQAREKRAWIRQQDAEYLRRTGLADVLARNKAQYVNVTEAWWDAGEPAPDPARFIPDALLDYRGCPFLSFAKFKGPTRLGISNLFGLIPAPLRSAWHGPNITWFAKICCDIAKLYASNFDIYGIVEGLYSAVRWNRQGLYRSRWGNYDLISDAGLLTASRGLVAADIAASRLQGQDVSRSAFFDVVREELGWDSDAAEAPLPQELQTVFV